MPAATTIVINDGAATPVSHTFTPIGKDEKGVLWFEQTTPVPATLVEAKRIGYRQSRSMTGSGTSKAVLMLAIPKGETVGNSSTGIIPPPTLAYKTVARVEIDLVDRSALQERKDLRVLLANLLLNASVVAAVDAMQPIY